MEHETIIHLVHGTWGRGWRAHLRETLGLSSVTKLRWQPRGKPRDPRWFEEGSEFRAEMTALLGEKDNAGRYRFEEFKWSGSNSFHARTEAAMELCVHLHLQVERYPDAHHWIVAHSHGGTVAVSAVTWLHKMKRRETVDAVRGVMTLATPFISLAPMEDDGSRAVGYLFSFFVAATAFLLAIVYFYSSSRPYLAGWLTFMTVCVCLAALFRTDFKTESAGVLGRVVSVVGAILYATASAGVLYCAWHGASELLPTAVGGTEEIFSQLADILRSTRDVVFFSLLLLGSALAVLLALTIGRQNEPPFRGVLRQFYLTVPLFLVIPVVGFAVVDAVSTNSTFVVWFVFLPPVGGVGIFPVAYLLGEVLPQLLADLAVVQHVDWAEPLELPVPLVALRAPRDEATLSIVFAQAARFVMTKSWGALFLPLELVWSSWRRATVLTAALAVAPYFLVSWPELLQPWYWRAAFSMFGCFAIVTIGVFFYGLAALALYLLMVFLSGAIMAFAVGWETMALQLWGTVECEPLPRIQSGGDARMVIDWSVDRGEKAGKSAAASFHHSLYDYPSVRKTIVSWIGGAASPASKP